VTSHGLSERDVKHLALSIKRFTQLYKVDLSGNRLRNMGVLAVSECLSAMPDLIELNVRDNNISRSDDGSGMEYRHQHAWMVLRMFRKREGRVLMADLCVHAVLEERVHLLHPRSHIGWLMLIKKVHVVQKSKNTLLVTGRRTF
jgi:hypothetical protein